MKKLYSFIAGMLMATAASAATLSLECVVKEGTIPSPPPAEVVEETNSCGPLPNGVELIAPLDWANTGSQTRISLKNQIKSIPFTTTSNPLYAGQVSITSTTGNSGVKREVWISKCPGVVTAELGTRCTATGNSTTVVYWHQNDGRYCDLDLNTEYYINVRNIECPNSSCDVYRNIYTNKQP